MAVQQPIIRGIQAVGAVSIRYRYNGNNGKLALPTGLFALNGKQDLEIDTSAGVEVAGFRLDSNFLRANPQIASSFMIPILGGGAIALTNNNRSGTLSVGCTRVSTPATSDVDIGDLHVDNGSTIGAMAQIKGANIGPDASNVFDLVYLAQIQQAQPGGDSVGATIQIAFKFCGLYTVITFEGCTIASVDPVGLSGNDAVDYNVSINYLNWTMNSSSENAINSLSNWAGTEAGSSAEDTSNG